MSNQTKALLMTIALIVAANLLYMVMIVAAGGGQTLVTAIVLFADTWIAFQLIQVLHYKAELKRKGYGWVNFDQANLLLREFGLRKLPRIDKQAEVKNQEWYDGDFQSLRRVFQETG